MMGESPARVVAALEELLRATGAIEPYFTEHRARFVHDLGLVRTLAGDGPILEIGSYPGYFAWCLRRAGFDATGVDLDPARTAAFDATHHLRTLRCDVEREPLPVAPGSCAVVVVCEVLEHLRVDPVHALREAARVLRPGGTLFLQTPNAYSAGNIARFVSGRGLFPAAPAEFAKLDRIGHMGHIREYTRTEVVEFVRHAGLRVASIRTVAHARARRGALADLAYRLVPPIRPYHVVIARRD